MTDFWRTLTELLRQYTIADTANVFAIIEGIATVVAAIGAIIAIKITKKIAHNQNALIEVQNKIASVQNELTFEQNKISAAQTELAKQQNRIALYERREDSYDYVNSFIDTWVYYCSAILNASNSDLEKIIKNIFSIEYKKATSNTLPIKSETSKFVIAHDEIYNYDLQKMVRLKRLFSLDFKQETFISQMFRNYWSVLHACVAYLENESFFHSPSEAASTMKEFLNFADKEAFLKSIEEQIKMTMV